MIINEDTGEIMPAFMRTPYNFDTDANSDQTGLACHDKHRTDQQFKDDADINVIVERFGVTGERPPTMQWPEEAEFMETFDFQTSMNVIRKAQEAFGELPAKVRARFDNDPQKYMQFFNDPENAHEAVRLGIATKREEPPKPAEEPPKGGTDTK